MTPRHKVSIDTLANHNFECDKSLLQNVKRTSFKVGGSTGTDHGTIIGTLPGFGDAAYLPKAGCNGFSAAAIQKYRSEVEPGVMWKVHMNTDLTLSFDWDEITCQ